MLRLKEPSLQMVASVVPSALTCEEMCWKTSVFMVKLVVFIPHDNMPCANGGYAN